MNKDQGAAKGGWQNEFGHFFFSFSITFRSLFLTDLSLFQRAPNPPEFAQPLLSRAK